MTTMQIRYILHQEKEKELLTETQSLEEKIKAENGIYFIKPENEIKYTIFRRAIATFTENESINLKNFGDLISIDPTYCNLQSNWS